MGVETTNGMLAAKVRYGLSSALFYALEVNSNLLSKNDTVQPRAKSKSEQNSIDNYFNQTILIELRNFIVPISSRY
jgi:hypothetical protein